ncbi:MAG TPA: DeoR/GlpR family DNA-binding transcription regulator [Candidatus Lumbricidophila sp.]|nr:DeoR/GlpR family DNA-binding transcription regulator [Candidatus Lumbricidophila sp.]
MVGAHFTPDVSAPAFDATTRRELTLALALDRGFVRVADLATAFGVTAVTARADLDALERDGHVRRVHGGAVPLASAPDALRPTREPSFEEALETSVLPKQQIGAAAAAMVRDGQSVILDVGTTGLQIARALMARADLRDVTIITSGLNLALELEAAIPRFAVILTGGALRPRQHSLVFPLAGSVLAEVHADIAFIGCNGVDVEHGVTNANLPEAAVKSLMVKAARRRVAVADASKLGEVHLARIAPIEDFDLVLTDAAAPAPLVDELRAVGVAVQLAGTTP